jgi:putative ABC transport system ATP-binding protein
VNKLIELTGVSKVYDQSEGRAALDGISLTIEAGELTAVMGPSGSGKSTLLNLIAGLDRPTQGQLVVDGIDIGKLSEARLARFRRERLGFIFQFFNLLPNLTVLDNVLLPAELVGTGAREATAKARDLLAQLGMADKENDYPGRLSGGQRQRAAIARALINRPVVILADEPTGALDSRSGDQVMDVIEELNQGGQTVLVVTHDAKVAGRYAQRIISLRDGSVEDDARLTRGAATPGDLFRPATTEARS